ncbi:ROK family transcriptional regulator [Paucilactobacillus suebicus]|nr:ROK family transcriptional regulator [Paucilactobacillus suebicus]
MSSSNMQSIQHSNYSNIYHLLYKNEKLSKQDIADSLDLSLPTVSSNLQKLLDRGLIIKNGQLKSTIGRRATAYSIEPNVSLSLGVEIFRNYSTVTILNLRHEVLAVHTVNLPFSNDLHYSQSLSQQLLILIQNKGYKSEQFIGVGIGIQGLISNDGTTILYGKILDSTGMKASNFSQFLPFPVTFFHDADCVAVAENAYHAMDGIFMSIGEHLGTAIIINGSILKSPSGRDGTMEHITLDSVNGRVCYCGRKGCIETYCSLSSLLKPNETLSSFFTELQHSKTEIVDRFHKYLKLLAESIYNLHMFVDIPIVIAGQLTKYMNVETMNVIKKYLKDYSVFPEDEEYLRLGHVVDHAVAIGAAIPGIEARIEEI